MRDDADEANLLSSCYETINILISTSAKDVEGLVFDLIQPFAEHMHKTLVSANNEKEIRQQNELQSLLSGVLGTIIAKLPAEIISRKASGLLQLFLIVLNSKSSAVQEEILMAIGSISIKLKSNFTPYLKVFKPHLVMALSGTHGDQVCQVSVGVIGDLCHAMGAEISPYCDEFVGLLMQDLQKPDLDRNIKPHIIACLADIALAVGGYFDRYLTYVMMTLIQASQLKFDDPDDFENIFYINQLRENILET